ncbi:2-dehydro-3-deoxyglucarate aldolase [Celerinatantimonas yamalensis]|uniref:2-dehydro-3-deoxyglucarate aldolase n=1 Tax=Celerinatantimonas yamalensis TaxID=559956 RepID=A0ABW9G9Z4_9GAMM
MTNTIIPNRLRDKLKARERLIGCWSALANPISTEILGMAGFDWLLLDLEHSTNEYSDLIPQLMALKTSTSAPIVRPQVNRPEVIKKLLDIGFYNFLIPYVENAEQAQLAVSATRYPPVGIRGVSVAHRSNLFGTLANYFADINDSISVIVQIESQQGVDHIQEIAAVNGVDGIFIGPADLSASLGHLGNPSHPDVQKVIRYVFKQASSANKSIGILAPNPDDAQRYLSWGANFVGVGSDLGLFKSACFNLAQSYK